MHGMHSCLVAALQRLSYYLTKEILNCFHKIVFTLSSFYGNLLTSSLKQLEQMDQTLLEFKHRIEQTISGLEQGWNVKLAGVAATNPVFRRTTKKYEHHFEYKLILAIALFIAYLLLTLFK